MKLSIIILSLWVVACSGDVTVHGIPDSIQLVPSGCSDAGADG